MTPLNHRLGKRLRQRLLTIKFQSKSVQGWIVLVSCVLGFGVYLPTWTIAAFNTDVSGMPHLIINLALIYLALRHLRRADRSQAAIEDQWLGSALNLGGLAIFYLYYPLLPSQFLGCGLILVGIILSTRGLPFLVQNRFAIALLIASLHPNLERVARHVWTLFTPPQALAKSMAWAGSWILRGIGYPAIAENQYVVLSAGTVEVAPGCDGFAMSFVIAIAGFIIGVFFQLRSRKIFQLIAIGIGLALVLNVCRIAVMSLAAVYWGKSAFEFWHGTIGGQIFSSLLFTIYYYITQPILNARSED